MKVNTYLKTVVTGAGLFGSQAMAHHTEEVHLLPFAHLGEAIAVGVAMFAIVSLLVSILLKANR